VNCTVDLDYVFARSKRPLIFDPDNAVSTVKHVCLHRPQPGRPEFFNLYVAISFVAHPTHDP